MRALLLLLLCALSATAGCARKPPPPLSTEMLGLGEERLLQVYGDPVERGREADGTPFLVFLEERRLEHSPDMIHIRTFVPTETSRTTWLTGPITTVESFEGESYVVEHRFWLTADRLVKRTESRIR